MIRIRDGRKWQGAVTAAALLLGIATWAVRHEPAQAQVERKALRPGLIATYRDAGADGAEVVQLDPTIALALKTGEAAHPRLSAKGGTVRWEGFVNILRAGDYQFSAALRGKLRLAVGGKVLFDAEAKADAPASVDGPPTRLEAGIQPLVAEFTRLPGAARLELFWKAPHFYREPLPHSALRHLPCKAPPALAASHRLERGRFLAEELSCLSCHRPAEKDRVAKGLQARQGPDLSAVGGRVRAGWLYHWLTSRPGEHPWRVMPHLFDDDADGRVEAYAVTRYLASLGGPLRQAKPGNPKQLPGSIARGKRLFTVTGCVVCHHDPKQQPGAEGGSPGLHLVYGLASVSGGPRNYPLSGLAAKTTPEKLAAYLVNPLAVDPSGRMPHMLLNDKEARDLANYLCMGKDAGQPQTLPEEPQLDRRLAAFRRVDPRPEELAGFRKLPATKQWLDLGKRLVIEKGCNNCHTIAPGGQPFANVFASTSFEDIQKADSLHRGCLAPDGAKRGKAPRFPMADADRMPIRAFLAEGTKGAGSPSPMHTARVALQRFNCLACHAREGEGGLTPELVLLLRRYEKAEDAESFTPPQLTGVGHKLLTPWLRQVLTEAGRARPWMGLRMPQFGLANVGTLPEALTALDGDAPQTKPHKVALTTAKIKAGRQLVGKSALGCISCHDLDGIPNPGTRGPDLALVSGRLRYDWYRRWLESAQRMQPGTKMPTVFPDGKSLLENVLGGSADAQSEAMWAYLSLGPTLPLPEGMEPLKGLVLAVKERPVLLRTFLPDAGTRAIAVGYPGGVSVAFDGTTCRLAYGWTGHFLDTSPVWDGRGGAPAKVLGPRFWTAPPGCPWGVNESPTPPDFAARASDPAFGGKLPEGKVFTGRRELHFDGYALDRGGLPVFRYHLQPEFGGRVAVEERPEPLRGTAGVGVARHFRVEALAQKNLWMMAAKSSQPPRTLDAQGNVQPLEGKGDTVELPAAGRPLVVTQGRGVTVLAPVAVPKGAVWHLRRDGAGWKILLRLPGGTEAARHELRLDVWSPWRDDPALLREIASQK